MDVHGPRGTGLEMQSQKRFLVCSPLCLFFVFVLEKPCPFSRSQKEVNTAGSIQSG